MQESHLEGPCEPFGEVLTLSWGRHTAIKWLKAENGNDGLKGLAMWKMDQKGTSPVRHHQLNGPEFESTPGVGDGQGGLACCSPWGCKESDTTEWLNWSPVKRLVSNTRWEVTAMSQRKWGINKTLKESVDHSDLCGCEDRKKNEDWRFLALWGGTYPS